jgi:hypothetical protein
MGPIGLWEAFSSAPAHGSTAIMAARTTVVRAIGEATVTGAVPDSAEALQSADLRDIADLSAVPASIGPASLAAALADSNTVMRPGSADPTDSAEESRMVRAALRAEDSAAAIPALAAARAFTAETGSTAVAADSTAEALTAADMAVVTN